MFLRRSPGLFWPVVELSILDAYSQVIAPDRPNLGALAALQRISPSTRRHRYVDAQVEAVREMDRPDALIDLIIEPFTELSEDHVEGLSDSLNTQLALRMRMRTAAIAEAWSLNPEASATPFDPDQVFMLLPNGEPLTITEPRLIAETGPFLRRALVDREPVLVETYDAWVERFAQHPIGSTQFARNEPAIRTSRSCENSSRPASGWQRRLRCVRSWLTAYVRAEA